MSLMGEQVIVFTHYAFEMRPSVCFYSLKQAREFLQVIGTSMLLHINLTRDENTNKSSLNSLFYTDARLCNIIYQDKGDLAEKLYSIGADNDTHELKQANLVTLSIDIEAALASDTKKEIDLQLQDQHQSEHQDKDKNDQPVKLVLQSDKTAWQVCKHLKDQTKNLIDSGPVTIKQSQTSNKIIAFTFSNIYQSTVFEQDSPNSIAAISSDDGNYCSVRQKSGEEKTHHVCELDCNYAGVLTKIKSYEVALDKATSTFKKNNMNE